MRSRPCSARRSSVRPDRLARPVGPSHLVFQHLVDDLGGDLVGEPRHDRSAEARPRSCPPRAASADAASRAASAFQRSKRPRTCRASVGVNAARRSRPRPSSSSTRRRVSAPVACPVDQRRGLRRSGRHLIEKLLLLTAPAGLLRAARRQELNQAVVPARGRSAGDLPEHLDDLGMLAGQQTERGRSRADRFADPAVSRSAYPHVAVAAQARRVHVDRLDHRPPAAHARAVDVEHRPAALAAPRCRSSSRPRRPSTRRDARRGARRRPRWPPGPKGSSRSAGAWRTRPAPANRRP